MKSLKVLIEDKKQFGIRAIGIFKKALNTEVENELEVTEGIISFEQLSDFQKFLSSERRRLINAVKNHNPESIKELALILKRDYKNVNIDVNMLAQAGFIKLGKKGKNIIPVVSYDEIIVSIPVSEEKEAISA
ncbi:MAG: HVO_A0114 family putative DNA-binding protein [bacterium]